MKCPTCGQTMPDTKKQNEAQMLELLNLHTGRKFRVLPRGTKQTAVQFTIDEIDEALEKMAADPWHSERMGTLSASYMLRPTTIDTFLTTKKERGFA